MARTRRPAGGGQKGSGGPGGRGRGRDPSRKDRLIGEKRSTRRSWTGAIGFGALAVVLALGGAIGSDPSLLRMAVLSGILAVVWALWALVVKP